MATKKTFKEYYDRARNIEKQVQNAKEEHRETMRDLGEDKRALFEQAKTAGVDTAALKMVLRVQALEAKKAAMVKSLPLVSRHEFDQMCLDLEGPPAKKAEATPVPAHA